MPVAIDQAVQLGAFKLQLERGDYSSQKNAAADLVSTSIPQLLLTKRNPVDWEHDIIGEWKPLAGKSKEELCIIALSYVKKIPFYGSTLFHGNFSFHSQIPF